MKPIETTSILVHVTGDRIGDALLKWPAIAGLKRTAPKLRLVWVAGRRSSVFSGPLRALGEHAIDELHEQAGFGIRWREMLTPVPFERVDTVIATEPKLRDALLVKRVPHRRFISPALDFRLSDKKLSTGEVYPRSVTEQLRRLFELAIDRPIELDATIPMSTQIRETASAILPDGSSFVGLSPGAGGHRKRWPLKNFIAIAERLARRGYVPVFFLGPDETDMIDTIKSAAPKAVIPGVTDAMGIPINPMLTIALAERVKFSLANDSGGGHLISAGGQPLVTLYGHTEAEKFKPPYGPHLAINAQQFGGPEVDRIPIEAVFDQLTTYCAPTS